MAGLIALRQTARNPALHPLTAVAPAEIIITASLNRVLDAMHALTAVCPLIGTLYAYLYDLLAMR